MSSDIAIRVSNLSKCYQIYDKPQHRLWQGLWRGRRQFYREFWALKDVSFEVKKGETVGIIGRNGSGKSTLLQLICGTLTPSWGEVQVKGRVAALLELGAGFNPEFTGRENVYMNASILGLSKEEIDAKYEYIVAFADIGEFIDQPVKTYSSGMYVRLAFAVHACVEPEVLIVDEALSVGDIFFQQKCAERMRLLMEAGTTILFVSHDLPAISRLCSRAFLMANGKVVAAGTPKEIIERYTAVSYGHSLLHNELPRQSMPPSAVSKDNSTRMELKSVPKTVFRYGDGGMRIIGFALSARDSAYAVQFESGDIIKLALEIKCNEDGLVPNVGFQIRDRFGNIATGTNTWMLSLPMAPQRAGSIFRIVFDIQLMLGTGEYTISPAIASYDAQPERIYDWIDQIATFAVSPPKTPWVDGLAYCPVKAASSALLFSETIDTTYESQL
jgi:lipopolysaccharide transport system ATP-binding protein